MFWRLTTVADDFGRFEAETPILASQCFPLKNGQLKLSTVARWFDELTCELVTPYVVNGKHYGFFNTWDKHQRLRAKHSKYPEPSSADIRGHMLSDAVKCPSESESESESESRTRIENKYIVGLTPDAPPVNGSRWKDAEELLAFLNARTGKHFHPRLPNGAPTKGLQAIHGLLKKGYSPTTVKQVIANRWLKWGQDPKMEEFLRPETLFRPSKFENYVGELGKEHVHAM
jgi:uncharacterized phage protein (TIGR02220 family)